METFILVICICFTFNLVVNLFSGFQETTKSSEVSLVNFCITLGLVIWGWFLYF